MESLDNYSKILVATQTLNYLGHIISSTNEEIKHILSNNPEHTAPYMYKSRAETDAFLSTVAERLREVCEDMGNFCDNRDMACEGYDQAILKTNFDVLYEREEEFTKN